MSDVSMNVSEAEVSSLERVNQSFVVNSHQMQDRRIEVVDFHSIFDHVHTVIVGPAILDAAFDSATGHPDGKAVTMMVSTIVLLRKSSL